jgi:hypothetical protein
VAWLVCLSSLKRDRRKLTARVLNGYIYIYLYIYISEIYIFFFSFGTEVKAGSSRRRAAWPHADRGSWQGPPGEKRDKNLKSREFPAAGGIAAPGPGKLAGPPWRESKKFEEQGVPGGGRHSRTLSGEAGRAPLEGSRQANVFPSYNSTAASQQPGFILLHPATPLFVLWLSTYGSKL